MVSVARNSRPVRGPSTASLSRSVATGKVKLTVCESSTGASFSPRLISAVATPVDTSRTTASFAPSPFTSHTCTVAAPRDVFTTATTGGATLPPGLAAGLAAGLPTGACSGWLSMASVATSRTVVVSAILSARR